MNENTMKNKKQIRDFFRLALNKLDLAGIIQLYVNSAVKDYGWFKSYKTKESVDKNGNPIPWNTYPFLSFIEPRLKLEFNIFEYGSGNSTIWYSQKVNSIVAVEHNKSWYEKVKKILPENAKVILSSETDSNVYSGEILKSKSKFEIVIVDGIFRNESLTSSLDFLTEDGVVVFDNSERNEYEKSFMFLTSNGFRRIDFWGMCPIVSIKSQTSIFYRDNNCLNI